MKTNSIKKTRELFKEVNKVIWDCDNTIWIHRKDEGNIIANYFGIDDTEELNKEYFTMFSIFDQIFSNKKVKRNKLVAIAEEHMPILKKYNIPTETFINEWMTIQTSFLNTDIYAVLDYLNKRGYDNLILTDWFSETQYFNLELYGILDYFIKISTCDNQYLKNNPKSAKRILKPGRENEYVIIGDSLNSDIAFATHSGIKSIWFNPEEKENNTKFIPTAQVKSLSEICLLL